MFVLAMAVLESIFQYVGGSIKPIYVSSVRLKLSTTPVGALKSATWEPVG